MQAAEHTPLGSSTSERGIADQRARVEIKLIASPPGGKLARRRYQRGTVLFNEHRQVWLGRYREDVIKADGNVVRTRPQVLLGTKKELPTKSLALPLVGTPLVPSER